MNTQDIFVFSSNLAGAHNKGAARQAVVDHGAIHGQGTGIQGNSYAIPVKDENLQVLPLSKIEKYVEQFLKFAKLNPELSFEVTRIGCGLDEYDDADITPMFANAPMNCKLPVGWRKQTPR